MDKPIIKYYKNGNIKWVQGFNKGKYHCLKGPARIFYNENGKVESEHWYVNGNEIVPPPYNNYPLTKEQQIEYKLTQG